MTKVITEFIDFSYTQEISNHPVHIINNHGGLSPSAFIPFCAIGGNDKIMGQNSRNFDNPVCNTFKPKLRNGQLCYQVDPNNFVTLLEDKKIGLIFAMDYNFDRMTGDLKSKDTDSDKRGILKKTMMPYGHSTIYIEAIGT